MSVGVFRDDLVKKLGEENLRKIESARIGIAGAGGLGSNCAAYLVRCGFRRLIIADFDVLDASNLDRQFYFMEQVGRVKVEALRENLLRISPDLELTVNRRKVGPHNVRELFGECDIVAECFDRAEVKGMLVTALLALGKPVVSVSGLGGIGNSDEIRIHKMKKNLIVVGDLVSDIGIRPALAPRVCVAAAKQADTVLDFIINNDCRG